MNDIYSYLNSKDVEEHCRSIGHKFNSLESCFIINDCYRISVQEKHRLFREIMETMPDSALSDRMTNDLGYSSFYAALKKTIEAEEHYLELLKHGGSNMVYTYKYRDEKMNDYYEDNYIFSTYDTALRSMYKDIMCEMESESDLEYFGEMTMRELDSGKYIVADFDKNGSIIRIYGSYVLESSEENEIFDWCWVYIPVPFKEGDILVEANKSYTHRDKMVLTSVCYWNRDEEEMKRRTSYWDVTDMTAYGCWVDDTGHLYDECVHDYHNLAYCKDELTGRERILTALSACKQGRIDESMLIIAYEAVQNEIAMKRTFPGWDYLEEYYKTAGIGDIYEKRKIIKEYERNKYGTDHSFY